ncbi:MAG: GTP-binding protein [Campylobacteraceae bacterium]|nr:GTP-binding protein [Campylobacteraceae bacterium]
MNLAELYPASFDNSIHSFTALMRSILIKSSYDSVLKKMTGYKGMYLNQHNKECWTLKFEHFPGIFGLVLGEVEGGFGRFHLHYFPSPEESMVEKFSLVEGVTTQEEDYIEKVRSFSSSHMLLSHFHIATLHLQADFLENSLILFYETVSRDRVYSKDGVKSPLKENEFIIKPNGLDKDLPSLRLLLPFMNFLNTTITRISNSAPSYFQIYKANKKSIVYDELGGIEERKDTVPLTLWMVLAYGKKDEDHIENAIEPLLKNRKAQKVHEKMSLNSFLQKAPWQGVKQELAMYPDFKKNQLKPKLVVITGFLGSGKTNLLQHYVEYETEKNRFVGIVQNEIGKTGLDGKLVDYDYSMVEIDEGCVCCSLAGQLRAGVNTLMSKASPDTILLETTGVANPFNLLSELNELDDLVDLEAIVTVVDASNALYAAKEFAVFNNQVRAADIILLNKVDLVDPEELQEIELFLQENNRCANIIRTVRCDINPNLLLQSLSATTAQIASLLLEDDETPKNHTHDGISSIKIEIPKLLNKNDFKNYLSTIPSNIYRLKGIVQFEGESYQSIVQYVHGEYEFLSQHEDQNNETFLIYIGKKMDKFNILSPMG